MKRVFNIILILCFFVLVCGCKTTKVDTRNIWQERYDSLLHSKAEIDSTIYYRRLVQKLKDSVRIEEKWYRYDSIVYVVDSAGKVLEKKAFRLNQKDLNNYSYSNSEAKDTSNAVSAKKTDESNYQSNKHAVKIEEKSKTSKRLDGVPVVIIIILAAAAVYYLWRKS